MKIHLIPVDASRGHRSTYCGKRILIGRSLECDMRVDDAAVSRRHCELTVEGGKLYVRDLGSRNGTRVNSLAVTEPKQLEDGDVLEFPSCSYRVETAKVTPAHGLYDWVKSHCGSLVGSRHATLVEVASSVPTENAKHTDDDLDTTTTSAQGVEFNEVDEAGRESFPASDPPAWTSGRA